MDVKALKRDSRSVNNGEWVGDLPHMGDLRVKVRGMGSDAYVQAQSKRIRALPLAERNRDGSPSAESMKRIVAESVHEAVLLDWDGLTADNQPFPYDGAVALSWLTDPDYIQFLEAVLYATRIVDNGRAAIEGDLAKN